MERTLSGRPNADGTVDLYPDSIEWGVPSKGGARKCYGNADDPAGFQRRIDAMNALRTEPVPEAAAKAP